ncbi:glutamate receptor 2.7-like [Pistacia vera]|uniref:glutamate receptor 2.7-like n=1 Tax=Pistacia vera TaxID=55513 RepID=UPI001263DD32|nr:glutamate receptor 2.7-like [Pistacia vera]
MSLALCSFLLLVLIFTLRADEAATDAENNHVKGIIGAIVDNTSRVGKEQIVAMEMAVEDFNIGSNQSLLLHIRTSKREPVHAVLAARDLINSQEVEAILGPQTWEETSLVAEIASHDQIPVLSFADATPNWAAEKWPFLLEASPNQYAQMKAIAAIVQSWEWHQVTVIYEDVGSSATGIIPHLSDALREVGAQISHVLALPPFIFNSSRLITKELQKLKSSPCRVFVVHLPLPLAEHLFEKVKKMKMMEKDYIWITTDSFTSLVHSINGATISSLMQGIIGVRSYIPEDNPQFQDFSKRFHKRFGSEYPEESNHEPGAFAVQAYDAVQSVASAMRESNKKGNNQTLLQSILLSDFFGLTGKVQFINQKVAPARIYQIINLVGRSYRELGFWTNGSDFSETIDNLATYNLSLKDLGQVVWPGAPLYTPKGWTEAATSEEPLRIGVPVGSEFKEYVRVAYDELRNVSDFDGFSIQLFKVTVELLPFHLPYEFLPFNGSYDDLVKQIYLKKFDAVVGDVAIVTKRLKHADFTHPYTESGLVMIVPLQKSSNKALLFMKPFTNAMWILTVIVSIYNGFVVWLIERNHGHELTGSAFQQTGTFLWLSFSSLFSLHGERLHSNLSRMTMVVWLFVALIISQTYTANLTSMLTVQGLEPTLDNIESLQNSNAIVGYSNASFVASYLIDVLKFKERNLRGYTSLQDYVNDLKSREIGAIFLEVAVAKIFLARYCKSFTTAGPTYKVGGFGFAFPKVSPLLPSVIEALLKVSESGKLRELETSMITAEKCIEVDLDDDISSLSPSSFWVLFVLTGATSTVALVIYAGHRRNWEFHQNLLVNRSIRTLILTVLKYWGHSKQRFSVKVCHSDSLPISQNLAEAVTVTPSSLSIEP